MRVDERDRLPVELRDVARLRARSFARDLMREGDQGRCVGARHVRPFTGAASGEQHRDEQHRDEQRPELSKTAYGHSSDAVREPGCERVR